jgi:O-acetyl-ADP-ribose deacetylase (regulator of RNase III)
VRLDYRLTGSGWAECTVTLGDQSVTMVASFLHDSLRDLASAALAFRDGAPSASALFHDEPGGHCLTFRRVGDDVEVQVDWYRDRPRLPGTVPCTLRLLGRTRPPHVPGQVLSALRRVLARHGEEGYLRQWKHHDFPSRELEALAGTGTHHDKSATMQIVEGDLIALALAGRFDVIVHGANCQCVMGAGIAKSIRQTFPEAYDADLVTAKGDRAKMGAISFATVERNDHEITVVNAYTQFHYRGKGPHVDYDATRTAMREVRRRFSGRRIGYPRIGAGLAGGDWTRIAAIVNEELAGEDHTLVEFKPAR